MNYIFLVCFTVIKDDNLSLLVALIYMMISISDLVLDI